MGLAMTEHLVIHNVAFEGDGHGALTWLRGNLGIKLRCAQPRWENCSLYRPYSWTLQRCKVTAQAGG